MKFSTTLNKTRHSTYGIQHTGRVLLSWVSFCWTSHIIPLCWVSLCWVLLCWVSLCWLSWRPVKLTLAWSTTFYYFLSPDDRGGIGRDPEVIGRGFYNCVTIAGLLYSKFSLICLFFLTCGLYYKHVTIVNDDSSVIISKWSFKLIDNPRVVIYDRNRFIIQATGAGVNVIKPLAVVSYAFS